jgi:endonuclease/exonuclease/phosphatase family metal-dependent hydrolase
MLHRPPKQIFRIGSFNLLNLVLPEHTYYGKKSYSQADYDLKKAWINNQLNNMQADIVGFQEVFHQEALVDVLRANPAYKGKTQLIVADPDGQRPSVGLLSKFPITDYSVISTFPSQLVVDGLTIPFEKFSRPVLKVRLKLNDDQHLIVVVAHLKSKRPMFGEGADANDPIELARAQACSLMVRTAEAYALRQVLMTELQGRDSPVVVLGDFNDTHTSVTTQLVSGEPPFRFLSMEQKQRQWDVLLYHVKDIQSRLSFTDTYYTHIHNGHYESLDHIMVSQELVQENPEHIGKVASVKVFTDHLIDETLSEDRIPCWKSDHAQVATTIEFTKGRLKYIGQD